MSKKEVFIKEVEELINDRINIFGSEYGLTEDAMTYFEALKTTSDKEKPAFTENGKLVLQYVKDNKDTYNNLFKAKDVADGLGITSKTVSGASRKLVTDGYLEKVGEKPVVYTLTAKGEEVDLSAE